jgi:hypothetical protein
MEVNGSADLLGRQCRLWRLPWPDAFQPSKGALAQPVNITLAHFRDINVDELWLTTPDEKPRRSGAKVSTTITCPTRVNGTWFRSILGPQFVRHQ